MQRDFSIWQRAEDRWHEARVAADEQRRIRQAEGAKAPEGREPRAIQLRIPFNLQLAGRVRRWLGSVAGFMSMLLVVCAVQGSAATLADAARYLAENVLGKGMVRSVRIADDGQTVLIRWESATYRPSAALAESRELLMGEAELTTGSILGRLSDVHRVRFSLLRGGRMLATGENIRGTGVKMAFAPELGGGTMAPLPAPRGTKSTPGGGSGVQSQ